MSLISEKFADELAEKGARIAYLAAQTRTKIVAQIRAIRRGRGWSQADFAKLLGKPQSNVSQRLENRDYAGFTVNTLLEVASTFDVGLVIEFVPYEDFIRRTSDLSDEGLNVKSFTTADLHSLREIVGVANSEQPRQTSAALMAFMAGAYSQLQPSLQSSANASRQPGFTMPMPIAAALGEHTPTESCALDAAAIQRPNMSAFVTMQAAV